MKRVRSQDLFLPHLNYLVRIRPFTKAPERMPNAIAFVRYNSPDMSTIYLRANVTAPTVAHEAMHVIQHICRHRNMDLDEECEHTAYLMQYIVMRATGNRWVAVKRK